MDDIFRFSGLFGSVLILFERDFLFRLPQLLKKLVLLDLFLLRAAEGRFSWWNFIDWILGSQFCNGDFDVRSLLSQPSILWLRRLLSAAALARIIAIRLALLNLLQRGPYTDFSSLFGFSFGI